MIVYITVRGTLVDNFLKPDELGKLLSLLRVDFNSSELWANGEHPSGFIYVGY